MANIHTIDSLSASNSCSNASFVPFSGKGYILWPLRPSNNLCKLFKEPKQDQIGHTDPLSLTQCTNELNRCVKDLKVAQNKVTQQAKEISSLQGRVSLLVESVNQIQVEYENTPEVADTNKVSQSLSSCTDFEYSSDPKSNPPQPFSPLVNHDLMTSALYSLDSSTDRDPNISSIQHHNLSNDLDYSSGPSQHLNTLSDPHLTPISTRPLTTSTDFDEANSYSQPQDTQSKGSSCDRMGLITDTSSEVSQIMTQFQSYLHQQEETEKERRDVNLALEACKSVKNILTMRNVRKDNYRGWNHLRQWIREVEMSCNIHSVRVIVIHLRAEKELLERLKYDVDTWKKMTWHNVKKTLMAKTPKPRLYEAQHRVLQNRMTATDDIIEFTARLEKEYEDTCLLMGVNELDLTFGEVLEVAITANMNLEGKALFGNAIRRDLEAAILKIEEAFHDKSFKELVFKSKDNRNSTAKTYTSSPKSDTPYQKPRRKGNNYGTHTRRYDSFDSDYYYDNQRYYQNYNTYRNRRNRPYKPARCWFYDQQGSCRYGNLCWYKHFRGETDFNYEGYGEGIPCMETHFYSS